ncbi:putative molybdenum carrier protein [Methylocaldum szegediense]|uniref:putative molybdenum carrier protein n=1 Tax=Methylocaldum szegediense TaxID=73780 RepID=UPI0003FEE6A1|nr:putative molybdenum carrier protein [Methylocaldum szegediense]
MPLLLKIVSGGQTGADRAALDAAIEHGASCGGWCPEDRLAEDGRIPDRYPLQELQGGSYRERTLQNVLDSDGTVIFYFGRPKGGTEATLLFCIEKGRPYQLIDGNEIRADRAADIIRKFVAEFDIAVLNVAGPRASEESRAYPYVLEVIGAVVS